MRDLANTFGFFYGFINPFQALHITVNWQFSYIEELLFEITNMNGKSEKIMGHYKVAMSGAWFK